MSAQPSSVPREPAPCVRWLGDSMEILDQTRLPAEEVWLRLGEPAAVVGAIGRLAVRGAPAIGVCGAFGVVLAADALGGDASVDALARAAEPIARARPTAANLAWAVRRVVEATGGARCASDLRALAEREALAIAEENREACRRIGEHGRAELAAARRVLTVCNTGGLATAALGTALGVVYAKAQAGEPIEVLACETRPLLQGARLTAWELAAAGIPVTVLGDGAAAAALSTQGVDAVIVGCDRVAANGDTANKVGTYALALAARAHGVPFYVAGPLSTFDPATPSGAQIEIEQRAGEELREAARLPASVPVWNPAFDVTPAALIDAFVTEAGVLRPPFDRAIDAALRAAAAA